MLLLRFYRAKAIIGGGQTKRFLDFLHKLKPNWFADYFAVIKTLAKGKMRKLKQLSLWWLFVCSLLSCRINPLGSIPHLNNVHSSLLPRRVCTFVGGSSKAISILETLHTHTQGWEDNPLKSLLVSGVRFIFHVGCRNYALLRRKSFGLKIRWSKKLDI